MEHYFYKNEDVSIQDYYYYGLKEDRRVRLYCGCAMHYHLDQAVFVPVEVERCDDINLIVRIPRLYDGNTTLSATVRIPLSGLFILEEEDEDDHVVQCHLCLHEDFLDRCGRLTREIFNQACVSDF